MKHNYRFSKQLRNLIGHCEIEGCPIDDPKLLDCHHIIPQCEKNENSDYSDDLRNLAILCKNHHALADAKKIIINGRIKTNRGLILDYKVNS